METAVKTKKAAAVKTVAEQEREVPRTKCGLTPWELIATMRGTIHYNEEDDIFNLGPVDNNIYKRGWFHE
jgi:hypothetical protein